MKKMILIFSLLISIKAIGANIYPLQTWKELGRVLSVEEIKLIKKVFPSISNITQHAHNIIKLEVILHALRSERRFAIDGVHFEGDKLYKPTSNPFKLYIDSNDSDSIYAITKFKTNFYSGIKMNLGTTHSKSHSFYKKYAAYMDYDSYLVYKFQKGRSSALLQQHVVTRVPSAKINTMLITGGQSGKDYTVPVTQYHSKLSDILLTKFRTMYSFKSVFTHITSMVFEFTDFINVDYRFKINIVVGGGLPQCIYYGKLDSKIEKFIDDRSFCFND